MPDLLLRRRDGRTVVVDVKPQQFVGHERVLPRRARNIAAHARTITVPPVGFCASAFGEPTSAAARWSVRSPRIL